MNNYICNKYLPNFLFIAIILLLIIIGIYFLINYKNPFVVSINKLLISGIALLVVGVCFAIIYLNSYICNYKNIFLKSKTSELIIVDGVVEDFKPTDFLSGRYDSFTISGVEFTVSHLSLEPGYNRCAAYGGIINHNGQNLKIGYIEYKNNRYIMSIECLEMETE